ncbi:MAG: hypothetical protein M3O20_04580 [Acidobacteriota bacterium]|nr:hypothetical protein [Acidobacteriota bacterium]
MKVTLRFLAISALVLGMAGLFLGQTSVPLPAPLPATDAIYACPMDPDVRGHDPGTCPRCGMKLVAGIPDPVEYTMDLNVLPPAPRPLQPTRFEFTVRDPWKERPVTKFQMVHERLFHLFVVSQDLKFFVHDHPIFEKEGIFHYDLALPTPGMYRILGDFYPDGATPQLIAKTVLVAGKAPAPITLTRDYSTKDAGNMQVELVTDPPQPIAHTKTMMFFKVKPGDGLEKYLGAWGHMLAASDDLIDLIHTHPFLADGGPEIQFNMIFPRARTYRVWVQFQRQGVVNTAYFDVPVEELK